MAEEKKKTTVKTEKKTTTKKVNNKNNNAKKTNTKGNSSKNTTKKNTKQTPKKQQVKKVTPKKVEPKKEQPKKEEVKKVEPKKVEKTKVEKVETPKVEKVEKVEVKEKPIAKELPEEVIQVEVEVDVKNEDTVLEKTLIFDGRENQNLAEVVDKLENDNVILEDKIIKRSKGKKIAVTILTILIFVTIIGTIIYVINSEIEKDNNSQTLNSNIFDKVSSNYDSIDDIDTEKKTENDLGEEDFKNIETITLGEFEKKILEKQDMYVVITSTTCYYSVEYESVMNEVFEELDKKIYRVNITSLTSEETTRFRTYYAFQETPTIFRVQKGVVTQELIGKQGKNTLKNWVE